MFEVHQYDKIKYVLGLTQLSIILLFYCWLQVSASQDHQQANIYNKTKNVVVNSTKTLIFYGKG